MTTGSTGKAPLADATRETGIEQAAQRLLVEVTAEDALRDRGAPSWLRLAEKPPASKHTVTEHDRRILEHDHVHRVGTKPTGRIGHEVEALAPPRPGVEPGGKCHGEIDVRARAGTA